MKLSPEMAQEIRVNARKELSRRNFSDYLEYVHHGAYQHYRHTELICNIIQPIADGKQRHVIIEMPPRHGKSMTVTESFPSFFVAKNPDKRVITTAYSDGLANKFGRLNRNKLVEFGAELFDIQIDREKSASKDWGVLGHRGGMISTGIGGSITGQGADLMIIDDPIKNNAEAQSQTIRDRVWDEWETTLSTRLHDGASVIVIMTRWHEDDFVGRILDRSPYDWERLRLPAIAEDDDDLLGREIGEALCAELGYDEAWAEIKKLDVGSKTWASLYQQRPSPTTGSIFHRHWWQYYDALPHGATEYTMSVDATFKDADTSDYVAIQMWARKGADKYMVDRIKARMDFPETLKAIRNFYRKHPKCRRILIEDKANGPAIISTLKREIAGIVPVNPDGGKIVRAMAVTSEIEAGNVYLPRAAAWVDEFVEECAAFPNGKHDDEVDAMTQLLNDYARHKKAGIITTNAF